MMYSFRNAQYQGAGAIRYPRAAPHTPAVSHGHSSTDFYKMINERYVDCDSRLHRAISQLSFPNTQTRRQCLDIVNRLRIHRNLFLHTYIHLLLCREGRHLHRLVDNANQWKEWGSVQQLSHHLTIENTLVSFWVEPCSQHASLRAESFAIRDDDSDLLCLLLYCGKKPELYELSDKPAGQGRDSDNWKESEQVIELLWRFLMQRQASDVMRRLRANIYRMARKSTYLPRDLQIREASISNKRRLKDGANGIVMRATVNGDDVVIKEILCGDHATQRKCLKTFTSEAILWGTLRHRNIVPFLGVIAEGTLNMGLVSPFYKNGNVRDHMKKYKSEDWPFLAKKWGRDLAEGLEYIHCHKPPIIHGDLKGDNVLIDNIGDALLGDFGQSYASDSGKYLDSTRVGLAAYSPMHWMAPELVLGDDRVKASDKSDIYSFGCVLYEMMSGKIPFEGLTSGRVIQCAQHGYRPDRPESISSDSSLWRATTSCWRSRPHDRPSAADLVFLLR